MSRTAALLLPPLVCLAAGCASAPDRADPPADDVGRALTFYASFDGSFDADYAAGSPALRRAASLRARDGAERVPARKEEDEDAIRIDEGAGVHGDALAFDTVYQPIYFYDARGNVAYRSEDWSGTVSFWLRLSPDEDLREGYSDPIQITARGWNDAAIFVDFTNEIPREFRFAIFPDRDVWDPERREWDAVPVDERPMVSIADHPFSRDAWTHVAMAWTGFNTGKPDDVVHCYLNGERVGTLAGRIQTHTWDPEGGVIWLGYHYRGRLDELAVFDRALTDAEIARLYTLPGGVRSLMPAPGAVEGRPERGQGTNR